MRTIGVDPEALEGQDRQRAHPKDTMREPDPRRCRYGDCRERHPTAREEEQITCATCRDYMGLPELEEDADVNPGPWNDLDGVYFEWAGQAYGPYATEDEAENDLYALRKEIADANEAEHRAAAPIA
jgi:hypothetical protein